MWTGISPTSGDGGYEKNLGREREKKREPENVTSTRNRILSNRLHAFAHVSYLVIAIYLAHTTHFAFTTQPNTLKRSRHGRVGQPGPRNVLFATITLQQGG